MKLSYLCLPLATVYFFLLSYWSFLEKKNSLWYFLPCSSACFSPPIKMHCPSLPLKHFCLGFPKDSMCVCTCTRVCICVCVCMCVCMCVCVCMHALWDIWYCTTLFFTSLGPPRHHFLCVLFSLWSHLVPFSILPYKWLSSLVVYHQPYPLFRLYILFNPSTPVFSIHLHGRTPKLNSELQTHLSQGLLIILLSCLWASSVYHIQTWTLHLPHQTHSRLLIPYLNKWQHHPPIGKARKWSVTLNNTFLITSTL